ncbi:MAG TPA: response regulator [Paludibacter sp.]
MMDILIIDDDNLKINKIKIVLMEVCQSNIEIASTISGGIEILQIKKFDLLILDLNIPLRENELPKKDGGLKILKELKRNPRLIKPNYIIGLTGFSDLKTQNSELFEIEGWTLLVIEENNYKWEEAIINKVEHIFNLKNQKQVNVEKILFLSASPINEDRLRVDEECKKIENELLRSNKRGTFEFITKFAVDFESASLALINSTPNIVHFSGHGNSSGIAIENQIGYSELITIDTLKRLFDLHKDNLRCIILNSCESQLLAEDLSTLGIHVIGMNSTIADISSIAFSVGFYQALGGGKDLIFAFKLGLTYISVKNNSDVNTPKLWYDGKLIKLT